MVPLATLKIGCGKKIFGSGDTVLRGVGFIEPSRKALTEPLAYTFTWPVLNRKHAKRHQKDVSQLGKSCRLYRLAGTLVKSAHVVLGQASFRSSEL